MKSFNLSDWALDHKSLVWYFMIVFLVAGTFSYIKLGREEDPSFTIKTMIIQAEWPGASAQEMALQVTDRIEKKLEELPSLDFTRSMTVAGRTTIFLELLQSTKSADVEPTWILVRNMIGDIQTTLPSGVRGPFFNDRFGDVFGNIYAFTSDGVTQREMRDLVESARSQILTLPNVGKVEIMGAQAEVVYLEFSTRKIAALGVDRQSVIEALQAQNAVTHSGVIESGAERVALRVSGSFESEKSLGEINLRIGDRFFPLSEIAEVRRGYADPPSTVFRYNGEPALGLAIGMKTGANLLEFGKALEQKIDVIESNLPIGADVHLVSDQPAVVADAVSGFIRALFEAVAIVLFISFISLGIRAGLIVAISIPLVLAITFMFMEYTGISMQRISLGALIIALGLLVDDAMIAVEMMVARLEAGDTVRKAATHVYTTTAFPMLTGTLVTVAGFIPIGLNSSAAGEFTFTLFVVIAVSLTVSWVVAVLFTPLLGVTLLPKRMSKHKDQKGIVAKAFSHLLALAVGWRWVTIGLTAGAFGLSIFGMGFVQQQFFPNSDRLELIVDWNLPHNTSFAEINRQMEKFEKDSLAGNEDVAHWSSHVGTGAPRFILAFDVQTPDVSFGQTVIVMKSLEARDRLRPELQSYLKETFPGTDAYVKLLDIGPPIGKPVQYRISGPDVDGVRTLGQELLGVVSAHPLLFNAVLDWNEPERVVKINVLQDKARQLGVTSKEIATTLDSVVEGAPITEIRDDIYLIDVIGRANAEERGSIETLSNVLIPGTHGKPVPLSAVATLGYELEPPKIWRRDRAPTITVKAAILGSAQPDTVVQQLAPNIEEFSGDLPVGYSVTVGGTVEESAKSQGPIAAVVPLMLFVMATILMIQLQSFSRLFLVFAVAPLALIGVVAALVLSQAPLGFVAILGVLALAGILIRNSVILVVQIEDMRAQGIPAWQAVIEATEHRMRPIMLTAAAATLALIPISREVFWGPMAYAMMGGIVVGTALTLIFLPALYVTWFGIKPETSDQVVGYPSVKREGDVEQAA
ncbi:efflux RND transporter permease subunit [Rhizobium sp. CG4]|uniref:efflux RND transporter permease subunit n=1 Tax=Rhizobium sp. CG4 TaxID=2726075 RepID=UPI002034A47D|nr:efflux RND transporter permease subunit [Rhizobium sp. CG4]MCM2458184.1 efflux RND transporter permease subunit [Rhizobium sp. CG4]